eukprot:3774937-Amphidinium_carterae.1
MFTLLLLFVLVHKATFAFGLCTPRREHLVMRKQPTIPKPTTTPSKSPQPVLSTIEQSLMGERERETDVAIAETPMNQQVALQMHAHAISSKTSWSKSTVKSLIGAVDPWKRTWSTTR